MAAVKLRYLFLPTSAKYKRFNWLKLRRKNVEARIVPYYRAYKPRPCETGLSDHHHMITTFMRSHLVRLQPKQISYREVIKILMNRFF